MIALERLSVTDLAEVLFASTLQESDRPTPYEIRTAVEKTLAACGWDCRACASRMAQEAGDHPDEFRARMKWALDVARRVHATRRAARR